MKVLTDAQIRGAVARCNPLRVAVAYVGAGWKTLLPDDAGRLEEVIVRPTLGSNPGAIREIADKVKWENLHLLDELHAKVYIGETSAVLGSANLTQNGLGDHGLREVSVEVSSTKSLARLNQFFDEMKGLAQQRYPTRKDKEERLKHLEEIANQHDLPPPPGPSFANFQLPPGENDHFYVCSYTSGDDCAYSAEVQAVEDDIEDDLHFAANDKVEPKKWCLQWRVTNHDKPHKSERLTWFYIDDVFEQGIVRGDDDYPYPTCAVQRKSMKQHLPPQPFEITPEVANAFKKAIVKDEIAKHLIQPGRVFSLACSFEGLRPLIEDMKSQLGLK